MHLSLLDKLKKNNFYLLPEELKNENKPTVLKDCIKKYQDFILDKNVPVHEQKHLSKRYIADENNVIKKYLKVLRDNSINPNLCHVQVNSKIVGLFHDFLESQGYSGKTYNNYMSTLRRMYKYFQDSDWVSENPWVKVKSKPEAKNPDIILEEEIKSLLAIISEEQGWGLKGGQRRNFYKPWLSNAFKLLLYTGCRPSGLFELKWKHVQDNYFLIPNLKINRLSKAEGNYQYSFITEDFAEFLLTLNRGSDEDYILVPEAENRETLVKQCSNGFTHFWRLMGGREGISVKNLRKTKLTREIILLGDKAKYLSSHKSDSVKVDHYIGQKQVVQELQGKRMFDI